jgi:histone deacetylase 6
VCQKLTPRLQPIASRPITTSELLLTHNHDLIDAVRRTPERLDGQAFKYFEGPEFGDTYFNAETSFLAELAAGGVTELLDHMADNRVHNGIAVIRPPGHHAECHKAMGFCVYNNVAVAINAMRAKHPEEFKKVLIVDWDVHHGNGTQNIFYNDPNVLFFSIHRSDNGAFYPSTGFHNECGDQEGKGFNINVPLPGPGLGDWEYVETWNRLLIPVARAFAPDLIVVSAGFDAALGDPLGGMEVTPAGYAYLMSSLLPLTNVPGRIAVALEGGYAMFGLGCCD